MPQSNATQSRTCRSLRCTSGHPSRRILTEPLHALLHQSRRPRHSLLLLQPFALPNIPPAPQSCFPARPLALPDARSTMSNARFPPESGKNHLVTLGWQELGNSAAVYNTPASVVSRSHKMIGVILTIVEALGILPTALASQEYMGEGSLAKVESLASKRFYIFLLAFPKFGKGTSAG